MTLETSMNEAGQLWTKSKGIAFLCFEGLWTKWMRICCGCSSGGAEMVGIRSEVRNWGSVVLR
jgi:hypothetical protein